MRQMKAVIELTVDVVEEDGSYWAEVAEIPGCFVSGHSEEEIRELLPDAVLGQLPVRGVEVVVGEAVGCELAVVGASPAAYRVIDHPARTSRNERLRRRPAAAAGQAPGSGPGEDARVLPMVAHRR